MTHQYPPKKVTTHTSPRLSLPITLSLPTLDIAFFPRPKPSLSSSPIIPPARPLPSRVQALTDRVLTLETELRTTRVELEDALELLAECKKRAELAENGERDLSFEVDQLRGELARGNRRGGTQRKGSVSAVSKDSDANDPIEDVKRQLAQLEKCRLASENEVVHLRRQLELHHASMDNLKFSGEILHPDAPSRSSGRQRRKAKAQEDDPSLPLAKREKGLHLSESAIDACDDHWVEISPAKVDWMN